MTRWYRAYEGTVTDAKLGEAALVAGCSRSVAIASWHCILESAASVNEGGLYDTTHRRVAVILGEPVATIEAVFAAFEEIGLVKSCVVQAWAKRQYESDNSTERSRKSRERAKEVAQQPRNGDATLQQQHATPPETETETEAEREQERARDPKHWKQVQGYLSDKTADLSDWEIDFLHSVKWAESLTKAQSKSLKAIEDKLKATEPIPANVSFTVVREGSPEWAVLKAKNDRLTARDIKTSAGIVRGTCVYPQTSKPTPAEGQTA